ncbi:MAG TPA: glycosyltransferase family 2 protein [Kiritimatiellia bacterium]|nr:glycosyltransferase family 2 protein [Kiritimatiellia bacterium]
MKKNDLAIICCLHSMTAMTPAFIAYHQAMGVRRFFLYLDRCPKVTVDRIATLPGVECHIADRDTNTDNIINQLACADHALQRCRKLGIDWLLHIDVDEFACGDDETGSLTNLLDKAPDDIEQIILRTRETIPTPVSSPWNFWEQHAVWSETPPSRMILDPRTNQAVNVTRTLGHQQGKSLVRTSAPVQAGNSHRWTRYTGKQLPPLVDIPTLCLGEHIHFHLFSPEQWLEKYRAFDADKPFWPRGNSKPFPKQAWTELASRIDLPEAIAYYRAWISINKEKADEYVRTGQAHAVYVVSQTLKKCGFLP